VGESEIRRCRVHHHAPPAATKAIWRLLWWLCGLERVSERMPVVRTMPQCLQDKERVRGPWRDWPRVEGKKKKKKMMVMMMMNR
jgi:hypothetical protein